MFVINFTTETKVHPINQRIKNIIDDKFSGNTSAFSSTLGYDKPQKVNRLFKIDERTNKFPVPSTEMLEEISNKFDISIDELVKGKKGDDSDDNKGVPYYDSDVTGSIVGSFHDVGEKPVFFVDFKPFNDCDAYFTIAGDSMYPKYQAGEILAVKQVRNFDMIQWGESYLVIGDATTDDIRTVKNVHYNERGSSKIILRASNPNFKGDTPISKEAILSMYIIKGKIKKEQL